MIERYGITIIETNPDAADFDINKLINQRYKHISQIKKNQRKKNQKKKKKNSRNKKTKKQTKTNKSSNKRMKNKKI